MGYAMFLLLSVTYPYTCLRAASGLHLMYGVSPYVKLEMVYGYRTPRYKAR